MRLFFHSELVRSDARVMVKESSRAHGLTIKQGWSMFKIIRTSEKRRHFDLVSIAKRVISYGDLPYKLHAVGDLTAPAKIYGGHYCTQTAAGSVIYMVTTLAKA